MQYLEYPREQWMLFVVPESERTKEVCEEFVKRDGRALEYVPLHLRSSDMCFTALKTFPFCIMKIIGTTNFDDETYNEMCLEAVKVDGMALEYVPTDMRTLEVCKIAVTQNQAAIEFVPQEFKSEAKQVIDKVWKIPDTPGALSFAVAQKILEKYS